MTNPDFVHSRQKFFSTETIWSVFFYLGLRFLQAGHTDTRHTEKLLSSINKIGTGRALIWAILYEMAQKLHWKFVSKKIKMNLFIHWCYLSVCSHSVCFKIVRNLLIWMYSFIMSSKIEWSMSTNRFFTNWAKDWTLGMQIFIVSNAVRSFFEFEATICNRTLFGRFRKLKMSNLTACI